MMTLPARLADAIAAIVGAANMFPLGLLVFASYGAVCIVPAWIGAVLRRRLEPARTR